MNIVAKATQIYMHLHELIYVLFTSIYKYLFTFLTIFKNFYVILRLFTCRTVLWRDKLVLT
jgi:hypothetical protein